MAKSVGACGQKIAVTFRPRWTATGGSTIPVVLEQTAQAAEPVSPTHRTGWLQPEPDYDKALL
jgi:hypothetical protein